jgi:hypothetical protein
MGNRSSHRKRFGEAEQPSRFTGGGQRVAALLMDDHPHPHSSEESFKLICGGARGLLCWYSARNTSAKVTLHHALDFWRDWELFV